MNTRVKQMIIDLKVEGFRYTDIAQQLNLPVTTVKSYVYRNRETVEEAIQEKEKSIPICPQCSGIIPATKFKPRRFCSDKCRIRYWSEHRQELQRKATVKYSCLTCGKQFLDYAGRSRRYCSHPCYIAARYHGGHTNGQKAI